MRLFIFALVLTAFLQTSFLQFPLCLSMLICRSYVVDEKQNYYLAFAAGLLLGFLSTQNVGFWALIFIFVVKVVHMIKKLPFTANTITILPVSFILTAAVSLLESFIFSSSFNIYNPILAAIFSLPILIAIRFWEERFTVRPGIKLKI